MKHTQTGTKSIKEESLKTYSKKKEKHPHRQSERQLTKYIHKIVKFSKTILGKKSQTDRSMFWSKIKRRNVKCYAKNKFKKRGRLMGKRSGWERVQKILEAPFILQLSKRASYTMQYCQHFFATLNINTFSPVTTPKESHSINVSC